LAIPLLRGRHRAVEVGLMITPAQCIEARKLLGWVPERLAPRCGFSHSLLRHFEAGERPLYPERQAALRSALEEAGSSSSRRTAAGRG
jgi:hypothetical protein